MHEKSSVGPEYRNAGALFVLRICFLNRFVCVVQLLFEFELLPVFPVTWCCVLYEYSHLSIIQVVFLMNPRGSITS